MKAPGLIFGLFVFFFVHVVWFLPSLLRLLRLVLVLILDGRLMEQK